MLETIATVAKEAGAVKSTLQEALLNPLKECAETTLTESPIINLMDTIENTSLECLKAQNEQLLCRNGHLEGKFHPENGVPFERKIVETNDGKIIEGVFPDFKEHKIYEVKLPENLLQETDSNQFNYCNEKLKESFDKGTLNIEKLTDRQIEQIKNGDKPDGFTWHHNEVKGKMELVDTKIHSGTGHLGGKSIWGGGSEAR